MQTINIAEAKAAELVAFFNANIERVGGTPVKKFADRKTAEKRVGDLVEKLAAHFPDEATPENTIPSTNGSENTESDTTGQGESDADGREPEETEEERAEREEAEAKRSAQGASAFSMLQGVLNVMQQNQPAGQPIVAAPRNPSPKASNSDGVAASWVDNEVRTARLKRDGVQVVLDGKEVGVYKSTYEAFRANRLPHNKHIRFRLKLKEAHRDNGGSATFEHNGKNYVFSIVEATE